LAAARSRDPEGWRRLVADHQSRIYRWCRRAGLGEADAADVAQEVFIAVARKLDDFRRDRPGDSFRKWLRAITTHKIQDHWRACGDDERSRGGTAWLLWLQDMADGTDPGSESGQPRLDPDDPRLVAVRRVRAEVIQRDWTIFERTVVDEQPPADVADELGVSVNVVYLVKSRVLRRVRACFAEEGGDAP
jgi:RNA polymerase sigma-70 factor (ECF subfamily)